MFFELACLNKILNFILSSLVQVHLNYGKKMPKNSVEKVFSKNTSMFVQRFQTIIHVIVTEFVFLIIVFYFL